MTRGCALASALGLVVLASGSSGCAGSVHSSSDDAGGEPAIEGKVGSLEAGAGQLLTDGGRASIDSAVQRDLDGRVLLSDNPDGAVLAGDSGVTSSASSCPLGAPAALDRVRFYPAQGKAAAMVGGWFEGSDSSQTNDFVMLASIAQQPAEGAFTELTFANDHVYRYIKYHSPAGSYGSVAELEFYHGANRLEGQGFGTASTVSGVTFALALDGDPSTAFLGSLADGNYLGLDIGQGFVAAAPTFTPAAGAVASATSVSIATATPGATIRYTLDGTNPSASSATYASAIPVSSGRVIITASASADCMFDSAPTQATYTIGAAPPVTAGFKSYHIGNSLTDTINNWLKPIADSTGVNHTYARWTIPGAPVQYIWQHKGEGVADPADAGDFDNFVKTYAPIDHLTIQPFADPSLTFQGAAGADMCAGVFAQSPNVQCWIYEQWASPTEWMTDALAIGASWADPPWSVPTQPTDWVTATQNQKLYHEKFRQYVDDAVGGKSVLVIPAGSALIELKRQIEAGLVPGITDFFGYAFLDELHMKPPTEYFVSLVFYSAFYKQTAEGRVVVPPELNLTDAQARAFQRIAWTAVSAEPLSGVSVP